MSSASKVARTSRTVGTLPPHHADPSDRLIIATARVESLMIVTSDRKFDLPCVPMIDARR